MRNKVYIFSVLGLLMLSGCKSLGKLTSKDQSSATKVQGSSSSMPRGFLDNIAVLPGEVKLGGIKVSVPPVNTEKVSNSKAAATYDAALSLPNKYANLLGVAPTSLTNLQSIKRKWKNGLVPSIVLEAAPILASTAHPLRK